MKKILIFLIFSNLISVNSYSLSIDRERREFQQCVDIMVSAGKNNLKSREYCICSVKKVSEKYSDKELDVFVSKGIEYLNKKTKFAAEYCAKKINKKYAN